MRYSLVGRNFALLCSPRDAAPPGTCVLLDHADHRIGLPAERDIAHHNARIFAIRRAQAQAVI